MRSSHVSRFTRIGRTNYPPRIPQSSPNTCQNRSIPKNSSSRFPEQDLKLLTKVDHVRPLDPEKVQKLLATRAQLGIDTMNTLENNCAPRRP